MAGHDAGAGVDLGALRRFAEAATPGSWDAVVMGSEGYDVRAPNLDSPIRRIRVARCGYEKWEIDRANAEHIAAFDPPTVLPLLDEIERLRACAASLRKVVDYWDGRPTTHHGDHIYTDLLEVLNAITPPTEGAQ